MQRGGRPAARRPAARRAGGGWTAAESAPCPCAKPLCSMLCWLGCGRLVASGGSGGAKDPRVLGVQKGLQEVQRRSETFGMEGGGGAGGKGTPGRLAIARVSCKARPSGREGLESTHALEESGLALQKPSRHTGGVLPQLPPAAPPDGEQVHFARQNAAWLSTVELAFRGLKASSTVAVQGR